ncbi:MAG: hypothetical protein SFX74_10960 [Fimbriimonadaceae bacterium]|nr:hypothetical protein [Fimbriimonadaceae bacterium]
MKRPGPSGRDVRRPVPPKKWPPVDLINWNRTLALATGISLIFGLGFSPQMCVRKVRVVGVAAPERAAVTEHVRSVRGISVWNLNRQIVESRVVNLPNIASASFDTNLFGRGVLKVEYREPVARLTGTRNIALAYDGTVYRTSQDLTQLPEVQVPATDMQGSTVMLGRIPTAQLAYVAIRARNLGPAARGKIRYSREGGIYLDYNNKQIVLGQALQLEEKIDMILALRRADPELLDRIKVLNVMAPNNPAARF